MPFIAKPLDLLKIKDTIQAAETAKIAVVRPTTRFEIITADNPDMIATLNKKNNFVKQKLNELYEAQPFISAEELLRKEKAFEREFQNNLSKKAAEEQSNLLNVMKKKGIEIREIMEDKGNLETADYDYFTDQIFATDTGQYFTDDDNQLVFIPAKFKNKQRQGEERLAIQQAKNLGAIVKPLLSKDGQPLIFEGGDIRQMPGKKLFFIGQGHRSDADTSQAIAEISNYYVVPIKLLQAQFYHLDCCFLPLPNDAAVIYEGEYELDNQGNPITMDSPLNDHTKWPVIKSGTETMDENSRMLIRAIYSPEKLILLNKEEAFAFATNAALLESSTGKKPFKLFVNGTKDRQSIPDEQTALSLQQISFTSEHIEEMQKVTNGTMAIVEIPYSTMHGSGGSVRCTIQEMACSKETLFPHKVKGKQRIGYFSHTLDKLEDELSKCDRIRREQLFFGNSKHTVNNHKQSALALDLISKI